MAARFVVGIDLGTTHTVVAYSEIDAEAEGRARPAHLRGARSSSRRASARRSRSSRRASMRRSRARSRAIPTGSAGELARKRGAEVVGRFVASAKSWLSHAAVDRPAPILPWGAPDAPEGQPHAAHLAGRRERADPRARPRRVGPRSPRRSARRAGGRAHGARVVRRGRARAHAACRRAGRAPPRAPRGAAGRVLRGDARRARDPRARRPRATRASAPSSCATSAAARPISR